MEAIFALLGLLLVTVWLFLPFAVFGVKSRMDTLIEETRRNNDELRKINLTLSGRERK